ncbi:MAG: PIN domain-containing protein [Gemmataceae bacterium]|nr:PIN domain-containing protein [Gemmataceae bacterium]
MNALDTNIWIYLHDKRDRVKQDIAKRLIEDGRPWVLLWQVGCEFLAAARKLEPFGFKPDDAWAALADMQISASAVLLPELADWIDARALQQSFMLSFWDALLIAACLRGGVRTLYTEDMGAPRTIEGLALVNPFLAGS